MRSSTCSSTRYACPADRFGAGIESLAAKNSFSHGLSRDLARVVPREGEAMKILIVEDEPLLAATLKQLVELNPLYEVTAITDDLDAAMKSVAAQPPELALVDLQLANGTSGFSVAARLHE